MQLDPTRAKAGADVLQHGLERVRAARCLTHSPIIEHGAQLRVAETSLNELLPYIAKLSAGIVPVDTQKVLRLA